MKFRYFRLLLNIYAVTFGIDLPMSTVVRHQYGVVFSPQSVLDNSVSVWHHTFAYRLDAQRVPLPALLCEQAQGKLLEYVTREGDIKNDFCPALETYNKRIKRLVEEIQQLQRNIDYVLPKYKPKHSGRGLIDAVGIASKFLFGLSTEKDANIMKLQIQRLRRDLQTSIQTVADEFQSFHKQVSERENLLENGIRLNREYFQLALRWVQRNATMRAMYNRNWINALHIYGAQYSDTLSDIRLAMVRELQGIQTLLEGYLPVNLVPPHELRNVLRRIRHTVKERGQFVFAHTDIAAYYHLQDITYIRERDFLYITLKIPISSTTTVYTVYRIHSIPIMLGDSGVDRSIIQFDEPYLAVSDDRLFFFTMTEAEYQFCQGNVFRRCSQGLAVQETDHPNCALALFLDDTEKINQLCDFTLLREPDGLRTKIISVNESSYLISTNDRNWIQSCAGGTPVHVKSCGLCIVELPCACALKARTFFIPAIANNCNDTKLPVTKLSHNYQALLKFYAADFGIKNLVRRVEENPTEKIGFPSIDLLEEKFDDVISRSQAIQLSLGKAADAMNKRQPVFVDKVSSLADQLGALADPAMNQALQAISSLGFLGSIVALGLTCRNMYVLAMLTRRADAIPWGMLTTQAPSLPKQCYVYNNLLLTSLVLSALLLCAVLVAIVAFFRQQAASESRKKDRLISTIKISFHDKSESITFPLVKTPLFGKELAFFTEAQCLIPKLQYHIVCFALHFNWSFLTIKASKSGNKIELPTYIPIGFAEVFKLRRILRDMEHVRLFVERGKEVHQITLWSWLQLMKAMTVSYKRCGEQSTDQVFISPVKE